METRHISELLTVPVSPALQTQELKGLRIGDEHKFEVAIKSRLIKDASVDEVKEALRFVMVKIGLRAQNWPNDLEKVILHQHIVETYGGNSVDEIRLAFDLAIGGKLDLEDVNCYENFSCLYFSKIMNAYRVWSTKVYREAEPKLTEKPDQVIYSQEENDNLDRQSAESQYQLFLKGCEIKATHFTAPILIKDGLMKAGENVHDFFKLKKLAGNKNIYVYVKA